ncbi:MAG: apbE 2 [Capsulimonas sp.]|nr:apbE 2 [Capsulimonas sp.]
MKWIEKNGPLTRRDAIGRIAAFALALASMGAAGQAAPKTAKTLKPTRWNDTMEMGIDFEINPPDGGRYHAPYVAVWLEDKDGNPVRTLSLWVETARRGPRWIPDLRRWYRSDQAVQAAGGPDLVTTVSSATRMPGRYSLVWNGLDDRGKPVPAGSYTLSLETAREHGPYTLMQKTIDIGAKPFTVTVDGNEEIKGATIEYRRK